MARRDLRSRDVTKTTKTPGQLRPGALPPKQFSAGLVTNKNSGGVLLSHKNDLAVPLALQCLTSEFGMGSGVATTVLPPETDERDRTLTRIVAKRLSAQILRAR